MRFVFLFSEIPSIYDVDLTLFSVCPVMVNLLCSVTSKCTGGAV